MKQESETTSDVSSRAGLKLAASIGADWRPFVSQASTFLLTDSTRLSVLSCWLIFLMHLDVVNDFVFVDSAQQKLDSYAIVVGRISSSIRYTFGRDYKGVY